MTKAKMPTFMALDILNCSLKWIIYNVNYIKEHQKPLEHLIEKFEFERDIEDADAEFLIREYLFITENFINATNELAKTLDNYLKNRGISNMEAKDE